MVKATTAEREFRTWCAYFAREPSLGDRLDAVARLLVGVVNHLRTGEKLRTGDLVPGRWPAAVPDPRTGVERIRAWSIGMAALTAKRDRR